MIDRMSPRERVAQLLVAGFTGTRVNDEIRLLVRQLRVGAIVLYSRNINTPEQLKTLTAGIRGSRTLACPHSLPSTRKGRGHTHQ